MKKLLVLFAFAFLFTTTTIPATLPGPTGIEVVIHGAEPDW